MKVVLFCLNNYAFSILEPIKAVLENKQHDFLWFVSKKIEKDFPFKQENYTTEIVDLEYYNADLKRSEALHNKITDTLVKRKELLDTYVDTLESIKKRKEEELLKEEETDTLSDSDEENERDKLSEDENDSKEENDDEHLEEEKDSLSNSNKKSKKDKFSKKKRDSKDENHEDTED